MTLGQRAYFALRLNEVLPRKKVEEIEDEIDCKQCKVAWDTINEISVRKASNRGMSKADNPAERVK